MGAFFVYSKAVRLLGVVQIARHIEAGRGVPGVAAALETELLRRGVPTRRVTLDTMHLTRVCDALSRLNAQLGLFVEIVVFSVAAPIWAGLRYRRPDWVTISHNDCLVGTVYVNHGVHRALVTPSGGGVRWRLLAHPLHAFLLVREALRYRARWHDVVVNFSSLGEVEHSDYHDLTAMRRVVIPNGVDLARFHPDAESRNRCRAGLGVAHDEFVLLFVGHEFRRKGLDIALDAVRAAPANIRLVVVGGTDAMVAAASRRCADLGSRVTFLGRRHADLPDLYRAADLLVLPSAQEAWPLVLLEAMASGLPCVATSVSSVPEIIQHGRNGVLTDRSSAAFADAVTRLATDRDLRRALSAAALATASRYGWDVVAERYLALITSLAE